MRGSKTPDKKRAEAVGLSLVKGVPAASKETGIPQRTIRLWKQSPEFAELRLSAREEVAATMWVAIQHGLDEVHAGLTDPAARLKDKADTLFGLIDRYQLLTGEATSRTESRDLTHDLDDHESEVLGRVVRDELARRADGDPAEPALEGATPTGAETA